MGHSLPMPVAPLLICLLDPCPRLQPIPARRKWEPRVGEAQEHDSPYWVGSQYKGLQPQLPLLAAHIKDVPLDGDAGTGEGMGGISQRQTWHPFPPLDPLFLSGAPRLFPLVRVPALSYVSLCVFILLSSISPSFCPSSMDPPHSVPPPDLPGCQTPHVHHYHRSGPGGVRW